MKFKVGDKIILQGKNDKVIYTDTIRTVVNDMIFVKRTDTTCSDYRNYEYSLISLLDWAKSNTVKKINHYDTKLGRILYGKKE